MADDKISSLGGLIPELHFDLIARVPVGLILFAFIVAAYAAEKSVLIKTTFSMEFPVGVAFTLTLVLSYVIGVVVSPLGAMVRRLYLRLAWLAVWNQFAAEMKQMLARAESEPLGANFAVGRFRNIRTRRLSGLFLQGYERILREHPVGKIVFAKMSAEAALCENLAAALLVFIALAPFHISKPAAWSVWWWAVGAFGLSAFAGWFRLEAMLKRMVAFLLDLERSAPAA